MPTTTRRARTRHRATRGEGDDEAVRARSRDDRRGRSRGGVERRRENDGIGASETDAMGRDDRRGMDGSPRAGWGARGGGGGRDDAR